jgi:hypothetical protein
MTRLTIPRIASFVLLVAAIATAADKPTHTYLKGTITGYDTRLDNQPWAAGVFGGTNRNGGGDTKRRAKVYELKGTDLVYQIDYCGSFQEGAFEAGQAVDYRVDGDRLFILREDAKEYKCKVEGKKAIPVAKPDAPPAKP